MEAQSLAMPVLQPACRAGLSKVNVGTVPSTVRGSRRRSRGSDPKEFL